MRGGLVLSAATTVVAVCALLSQPALAQSNPSADQILQGLKPGATRGIRPSQSAPTPPAAAPATGSGTPVPAPSPHTSATATPTPATPEAPTVSLTVEFATGSAQLTPQAMATLNELGKALASPELAGNKFRIEGHTDTVGSRELNQTLSERRANSVVDYLVRKFTIDRSRLEPVGMGEEGLAVPTPPQTPEPRNRRVQVVNLSA
jgi:outer membrane protein OmpA-like peptidoglycan-associated protein